MWAATPFFGGLKRNQQENCCAILEGPATTETPMCALDLRDGRAGERERERESEGDVGFSRNCGPLKCLVSFFAFKS